MGSRTRRDDDHASRIRVDETQRKEECTTRGESRHTCHIHADMCLLVVAAQTDDLMDVWVFACLGLWNERRQLNEMRGEEDEEKECGSMFG